MAHARRRSELSVTDLVEVENDFTIFLLHTFQCRLFRARFANFGLVACDETHLHHGHTTRLRLRVSATETQRLKGDQTEVFKILNGHENIDCNIFFFKIKTGKMTRGLDFTLVRGHSRLDV